MLTKFASFESSEILEVKGSRSRSKTASLDKLSDFDSYRTSDGYMYARIKAISSRVNKNHDAWPSVELAGGQETWDKLSSARKSPVGTFTAEANTKEHDYGYSTFVGKPIFVDHNNSDPKRARGVIVDAKLHVHDDKTSSTDKYWTSSDADPSHLPPTEIELLLEIDAKSFPKLAKAIEAGSEDPTKGIDGFSMGCDVDYSKCSHCGNKASSPSEYCSHIQMEGAEHPYESSIGKRTSRKSYENCYGIKFFEISAVFDPADETALLQELVNEQPQRRDSALSQKHADRNYADEASLPQVDKTKAPEDVDTLREEKVCPVCGEDTDGVKCDVCAYEFPPDGMDNPDLQKAQENGLGDPHQPGEETLIPPDHPVPPAGGDGQMSALRARKTQPVASITNDIRWTPSLNPKAAAAAKRPIKPGSSPATDEPKETVISDQLKPVTSTLRTAQDMIARAAKRNQPGEQMSDQETKVAAEPADPSGKPKKQVDVEGVGGVDQASAEQASKADKRVDVEGKGATGPEATNESASAPDKKEDVEKAVRTDDSGPTKTFDNSNEPNSAVTDKAYPTSAKKGTDPVDSVGKADSRVDLEEEVSVSWNGGDKTDQWTGTDGNGVTRQAPPVTRGTINSHTITAFRLVDNEIELGITSKEAKWTRVAELAELSPEELVAEERVISRVKTAGLSRVAATQKVAGEEARGIGKLPSFRRVASAQEPAPQKIDDGILDSAIFSR